MNGKNDHQWDQCRDGSPDDQARKEAMSNTCLRFLYILWLNHPEIDFIFFGEEAIEEVNRYATEAIKDAKTSTPLNPTELVPSTSNTEVLPAEATKIQPIEDIAHPS